MINVNRNIFFTNLTILLFIYLTFLKHKKLSLLKIELNLVRNVKVNNLYAFPPQFDTYLSE